MENHNQLKIKVFALKVDYYNEEKEFLVTALNEKEAISMFNMWLEQNDKDFIKFKGELRTIRKNKKNYRYFTEDYYNKELKLLGLEKENK